jgi:hypothetical protein
MPERIPEREAVPWGDVSGANSAVELVKMPTVDKLATVASLSKDPAASLRSTLARISIILEGDAATETDP